MQRFLLVGLRVLLGAVFLYAAWTKFAQGLDLFALSISTYQLLPANAVMFVAHTLPYAEALLGVLLVAGPWLRWTASAAAGLLVVFFAIMLRSYFLGLGIDCGCFGVGEALGPQTLVRDGLLLAAALALVVMAWRHPPGHAAAAVASA